MTPEQKRKCHTIIHTASAVAGAIGAGLAQLPCSDNAAIIPIQLGMVLNLSSIFGIRLAQAAAQSTLATATTTALGRSLSQALVGWVPLFGNICNALTGAAVTEVVGWAVANDFANRSPSKNNEKEAQNDNHKKRT